VICGDLSRRARDLMVIVTIELGSKDFTAVLDGFDIFPGTGLD
jgi:hypothetical protein